VVQVAQDSTWDVLALAAQEEADEVRDGVDADPLSFKFNPPLAG
jgi:hypothetical protein